MLDKVSPEARRFIVTAAGVEDEVEFAVAVAYVANKVPPIERNNLISIRNILNPAEVKSPLEVMLGTIDSPECPNPLRMSVAEQELWNRAERIRMVWGFEHSTGADKIKFGESLKNFARPL